MAKKNIVVVECYSSAVNYIHDIRERGYEPVLLECHYPEEVRAKERALNDAAYAFNGDPRPLVLMADERYENTLEVVRQLEPILILPGSDPGLELSLRLSADLGLRNNPPDILWNLRDKLVTQQVLRTAGTRHIKSHVVRSEEEAVDHFKAAMGERVVVKPTQGASSVGVFVCGSEDDVRRAYRKNDRAVRKRNRRREGVIVQQYVDGDEYALDTISCAGRHVALYGMRYYKRMCEGFGKIYDTDVYFSPDDASVKGLVDYSFEVLSCLGVQYGAAHSEFIVDGDGPVLVECNARPAGAFQRYTFQDKVMHDHETAVSLDSYLMDPERFFARYPERMRLRQPAAVREICLEESIYVEKSKLAERLSHLKSFDYAIDHGEGRVYPKTTDLDSNGGIVYLTAPDEKTIEDDLRTILELEESLDELFDWHRA